MKIYLLDFNSSMTEAWSKCFHYKDVEIVHDNFAHFMDSHPEVEAIVSPANSFGLMDGGYDKAIIDYFGSELMDKVQNSIIYKWYGEQPVGTSMAVQIPNSDKILIHTPTMRTPERITDTRIVYQCMRACLIEAMRLDIKSIAIPAFGGSTGRVPCNTIAMQMYLAYKQVINCPDEINWEYANRISIFVNINR